MDKLIVQIGRTYNIGNYESVRLDVGISRDVENTKENRNELYKELLVMATELKKELGVE